MRRSALHLLLGASLLAGAAPISAQSLAARIARLPDGPARFQYPAHPDVCGDGETIIRFRDGDTFSVTRNRGDSHEYRDRDAAAVRARCRFGPAFATVEVRDGRAGKVEVRVGEPGPARAADLGSVSAAEAIAWLAGPAAREAGGRGSETLFAATIANGDWGPAMLALATDRAAAADVRKHAIFWTSQAAGEKAAQGLHSILADDSEELDLRKHAVFALSQLDEGRAIPLLLDVAERSPEPEIRKAAFFWLGQKGEDPRVIALFQRVLLDRP
jgi:hypothetical protein